MAVGIKVVMCVTLRCHRGEYPRVDKGWLPRQLIDKRAAVLPVEEQDEIPGHSVGGLDVKIEVGRNLGLRKSKQDYKKEGRRERKFKRKFFFPYASV